MYSNLPKEQTAMRNAAAVPAHPLSATETVVRAIEGPFRRLGWYLRTSGILGRVTVRLLAAALFVGAVGSIVWLATSLIVAL